MNKRTIVKQTFNNLQILRAFAALNVVLLHAIGMSAGYGLPTVYWAQLGEWGANGVDVFFVISGFIMVYISATRPRTIQQFLRDRCIRIIPLYWSFLCVAVIMMLALPQLFATTSAPLSLIITSFTFTTWPLSERFPLIGQGWTLEYELVFYLIFAFSLVFKRLYQSALFTALALGLLYLALPYQALILELALGMALAFIFLQVRIAPRVGLALLIIGAVLLLASVGTVIENRLLFYGVPAAFLVLGAVCAPQWRHRLFITLGDASYSIYLIQFFTLPAFYKLVVRTPLSAVSAELLVVASVLLTALAGWICHKFYEKPLLHYLRTK